MIAYNIKSCICSRKSAKPFAFDATLGPFRNGSFMVEIYVQDLNDVVLVDQDLKGVEEVLIAAG